MRVHFIAIGGSAMHNLALALHSKGYQVTGSDDEIYDPSRSRLEHEGLLPTEYGWFPDKISTNIDAIILGMHARANNPELLKAQKLGLKIYSYPEFIAEQSINKKMVVIAGSHGKTTTTSIILHVLKTRNIDFDYLVGAQIEGFERMVRLSDAPLMIIEGDEYLSSPIDRRPKIAHYDPDIAVITGVAWDHINVFPTYENYEDQFRQFIVKMKSDSKLIYFKLDDSLVKILNENGHHCSVASFDKIELSANKKAVFSETEYSIPLIGTHNMQNIKAAEQVCLELGLSIDDFYDALSSFSGAAKRLQVIKIGQGNVGNVYLDFAHAPSKVRATTTSVKEWFEKETLTVFFELHTYSSLNVEFLPQYKDALEKADRAIVFFNDHAIAMKKMKPLDKEFVKECFDHSNISVASSKQELMEYVNGVDFSNGNTIFMTSGNFDKLDFNKIL